jgi:hypothetical protein
LRLIEEHPPTPPAIDRLAWLVACEEIRQLASRYAVAVSHGDLDRLVALFVSDVRVGRTGTGRDALRDDFSRQLAPLGQRVLHVTNHVVDVADADHAAGVVGTRAELELGGEWIVQMIEYHDDYRRTDDGWRFVRRRHMLWYGAPVGTSPLGLPPANWPASAVSQGDLPGSAPLEF